MATGFGLYRSADGGRSFQNVQLPTGRCAGNSLRTDCFLANMVTDVVVQSADHFGHPGGAVLAAVGWRAGAAATFDGSPQSPANGLYSSATGMPGSFQRLAAPGFAAPDRIGRVAWAPRAVRTRTTATSTPRSRTSSCSTPRRSRVSTFRACRIRSGWAST